MQNHENQIVFEPSVTQLNPFEDAKKIFSACRMVQLPNVLKSVTIIGQYTRPLKQRTAISLNS